MHILKIVSFFLLLCFASHPFADSAQCESGDRLVKMVGLSRHGVRSPTQKKELLELWSTRSWPLWPVEQGYLTQRGAHLVSAMWANMREIVADAGILPRDGCPVSGKVFIRADTDERTRATATAILAGLLPGCNAGYAVARHAPDPLFHPVKAGLYTFDPTQAATDILSMTGGGLAYLQEIFAGPLGLIDKIAGPPAPALCARYSLPPECHLYDFPNGISVSADGRNVQLSGGLSIASSLAEIFLLEYGEWPGTAAGWGQVDATTLSQILPVHSRIFDVVNRAPLISWARGASLLNEIYMALTGGHGDGRINEAAIVIFVGHDTNIANIGGLLGVNWRVKGYPLNGIPPAGVLMFELWENEARKYVKIRFYAQPPSALHASFTSEKPQTNPNMPFLPDDNSLLSESNIKTHAPVAGVVNCPPVVGEARYSLDEFRLKVQACIAGAPIAPPNKDIMFVNP